MRLSALLRAQKGKEMAEKKLVVTLRSRIAELIEQHGSLRAAARVLDCDPGYLSRLQSGEKDDPGAHLLRRMGLRQTVTYDHLSSTEVSPMRTLIEEMRQEPDQ